MKIGSQRQRGASNSQASKRADKSRKQQDAAKASETRESQKTTSTKQASKVSKSSSAQLNDKVSNATTKPNVVLDPGALIKKDGVDPGEQLESNQKQVESNTQREQEVAANNEVQTKSLEGDAKLSVISGEAAKAIPAGKIIAKKKLTSEPSENKSEEPAENKIMRKGGVSH